MSIKKRTFYFAWYSGFILSKVHWYLNDIYIIQVYDNILIQTHNSFESLKEHHLSHSDTWGFHLEFYYNLAVLAAVLWCESMGPILLQEFSSAWSSTGAWLCWKPGVPKLGAFEGRLLGQTPSKPQRVNMPSLRLLHRSYCFYHCNNTC